MFTLNIPVVGVIENMSYLECPDCRKKIKIFESIQLNDFLEKMDIKLLGELPMCREIADLPGGGKEQSSVKISEILEEITGKVVDFMVKKNTKEGGTGA